MDGVTPAADIPGISRPLRVDLMLICADLYDPAHVVAGWEPYKPHDIGDSFPGLDLILLGSCMHNLSHSGK